jgi:tetratricopeptide (TPR) repeat protein
MYGQAIALNPNNASAHEWLSGLLCETGRLDEALREGEIAEELDPKGDNLAGALQSLHDYDRAIATLQTLIQNDPDNGVFHHDLFLMYAARGMHKEAMQELERTLNLFGLTEVASRIHRAFVSSGYSEFRSSSLANQAWTAVQLSFLWSSIFITQ